MESKMNFDKLKQQFDDVFLDQDKFDFKSKYTNLDIGNLLIDSDFSSFLNKQNEILDNTIKCNNTLSGINIDDLNTNKQDDIDIIKNTVNNSNYDLIKVKNDLKYITDYINNLNTKLKETKTQEEKVPIEQFTNQNIEHFDMAEIIQPLKDFGETIKKPFVDIGNKLEEFFRNFVNTMKDVISKIEGIAKSVGDVLKKVFEDIFGTLKSIFEFIWLFLQGIGEFIKMLPTYINYGITYVKALYNTYVELYKNLKLHWFGAIVTTLIIYIFIMVYSNFTFGIIATPIAVSLGPAVAAVLYLLIFDKGMLVYLEDTYKSFLMTTYTNPLSSAVLGISNENFVKSGNFTEFLNWVPGNLITCTFCFLIATMILKTLIYTLPRYLIGSGISMINPLA